MTIFGETYADAYDFIYADKDYELECDLIENIFNQYSANKVQKILDLGCGTGNHSIPLAKRGYDVTGIELHEPMLQIARRKVSDLKINLNLELGDIRSLSLNRKFDGVLILFAVLGYQITNDDVLSTLRNARKHMMPGGVLFFDVWYGPAVLKQRPVEREKTIPISDGKILRWASGELDPFQHICTVRYRLRRFVQDRLVQEVDEAHTMRYFFPQEIAFYLSQAGFNLIRLARFPEFDREPDEDNWNVAGVARAI